MTNCISKRVLILRGGTKNGTWGAQIKILRPRAEIILNEVRIGGSPPIKGTLTSDKPDISGKSEISGIPEHDGVYQVFLVIVNHFIRGL